MAPLLARTLLCLVVSLSLLAAACGGSNPVRVETQEPSPVPTQAAPVTTDAAALSGPQPTPTMTITGPIGFAPAQMVQGGFTVVYLAENASSATLRFQERQYPMLHDGSRWWAIIGVGAFTQAGLYPVSITYTPSGRTESATVTASVPVIARSFPVENIELDSTTASLLAPDIVNNEIRQRAEIFSGFTAQRMWTGPFQLPSTAEISGIYGEGRSYNNGPVSDYHKGTDFVGQTGDPVVASANGRVVFAGELRVRGGTLIIDHGAGVFTSYNHLSSIDVKVNDLVQAGARIGAIGSTGLVTGPHLHWEVVIRGVEIDGELWLAAGMVGP